MKKNSRAAKLSLEDKYLLARSNSTSPKMLESLIDDSDAGVRAAVAHRTDLSAMDYLKLSKDREIKVLEILSRNLSPNLPEEALEELVQHYECAKNISARVTIPSKLLLNIYSQYGFRNAALGFLWKVLNVDELEDLFCLFREKLCEMDTQKRSEFVNVLEIAMNPSWSNFRKQVRASTGQDNSEKDNILVQMYNLFTESDNGNEMPTEWVKRLVETAIMNPEEKYIA